MLITANQKSNIQNLSATQKLYPSFWAANPQTEAAVWKLDEMVTLL